MNIFLIAINARFTHSNLALRYLRNYANEEATLLEFTINQNLDEILEELVQQKPEVICFSAYIWNSVILKKILSVIGKILPDTKIVLGGPEVSYNADIWLEQFSCINYIITGAGEAGWQYLLQNNFQVEESTIAITNHLFSEIPFPYLDEEFPNLKHKYIYYESSRGCPFKCSYCLSSRLDQGLDYRNLDMVKQELSWLISKKPKIIKFVDRTFNSNNKRAREIWQYLIDSGTSTKFHFELHPSLLTELDFEVLARAPKDLFQFEIGIQSTNLNTIKEIGRFEKWGKIKNNIARLLEFENIHSHSDMIVGLPFEDMNKMVDSFNNIYNLHADHFQVGFLKVLPGTEMAEKTEQYNIVAHDFPPYEILQNKWMSFEEIRIFKNVEHVLELLSNSEKFSTFLQNMIPNFTSPFHFFHAVSAYFSEVRSAKWEKSAAALLEFCASQFPDDLPFFKDCLKWDFCLTSKIKFFPKIIDDFLPYKDLYHELIENKKEFNLSYQKFKKSLIFQPESNKFRELYFEGKQLAVVLSDRIEFV